MQHACKHTSGDADNVGDHLCSTNKKYNQVPLVATWVAQNTCCLAHHTAHHSLLSQRATQPPPDIHLIQHTLPRLDDQTHQAAMPTNNPSLLHNIHKCSLQYTRHSTASLTNAQSLHVSVPVKPCECRHLDPCAGTSDDSIAHTAAYTGCGQKPLTPDAIVNSPHQPRFSVLLL